MFRRVGIRVNTLLSICKMSKSDERNSTFLDSLASADQEERQSVRHSKAKELAFKALFSTICTIYMDSIYLTTDFVIDAQDCLPLGIVKHDFQRTFDDSGKYVR